MQPCRVDNISELIMRAIILAGGRGTRLKGIISEVPKPMADISGRPFLSLLLDYLKMQGFEEVVLAVGYMAENIQEYFGGMYRGIRLKYSREEKPLGTGGAICLALQKLESGPVFIINGDTFVTLDYKKMASMLIEAGKEIVIGVTKVPDTSRYGRVEIEDGYITGFLEKGEKGEGYINAGVYLFSRELISSYKLQEAFSFETDILYSKPELIKRAFKDENYFIDIGIPEDYLRAQTELIEILHNQMNCT
ncbi:MAG: nucleotidyltransferase family protein [Candidatus Heimdallarchaeota archaeon]|nr:nucleotidyltransferase family protein [Candidatus Heimdallarchaeota archaeon]